MERLKVLFPSENVSTSQACNVTSFYHVKQLNPRCHFNSSLLISLVKEEETSNHKLKIALCIPLFHTCDEDRWKWKHIKCSCMYEVAVWVTCACCIRSEPESIDWRHVYPKLAPSFTQSIHMITPWSLILVFQFSQHIRRPATGDLPWQFLAEWQS